MKRFALLTGLWSVTALINATAMSLQFNQDNIGLAVIAAALAVFSVWRGSVCYKMYVETRPPKQ